MARHTQITTSDLTLRFQVDGALSAQTLAAALGVTQPTISRGLARLGDSVVVLGAARRTRYALRRAVRSVGDRWPVYRIDSSGHAREWARLHALYGGFQIEWAGEPPAWADRAFDREGFVDGFPFFLGDLRPQGFLGRQQARRVADTLRLPEDPREWGDDDTLVFLQAEGDELPGDLIVGDAPLRRMHARALNAQMADQAIAESARATRYPELATLATAGGSAGSSAGGEQPKFLPALLRDDRAMQPVLVKFSPPVENTAGRRWADLLAAEAHALAVLAEHGLAVAGARVFDADGRRFLEVARYDRVGARGRRGVVSLEALHATLGSRAANDWPAAVASLVGGGMVETEGLTAVQRLHSFGGLIGNSDMHFGNLSFWLDDTLPFRPTPAYDMLPMIWAPNTQGELVERAFAPRPPLPETMPVWREVAVWAAEFWQRVTNDDSVSPEFATRAREAGAVVARMREHFGEV